MEISEIYAFEPRSSVSVPLFTMSVSAGIPIPVDSDIESVIDLNEYLIEHPTATFFAKVNGDAMADAGIRDGDILIVDTSLEPADNRIVVASVNGDFTIKIFRLIEGNSYLQSSNEQFVPLKIEPYIEYKIVGIVTKIIHSV